ncbi:MAG: hypothetical protein GY790_11055 [Bacteroidetes bacterium]|nr:hypothetical protein [Bacteroidota bacterium]
MEQIIELWQQAKTGDTGMDRGYHADELVPMIIKLERKQQKLITFKTLSVVCLLMAMVILFINRMEFTLYTSLGLGIFLASTIAIVILINRLRFRITERERSLSTLELAGVTEHKVNTERRIFTTYLPLFIVVALTAINLLYVDLLRDLESNMRILYHLVLTGGIAAATTVGLSVRIKRYRKQFLPLLDRIRKFKEEAN